MGNPSPHLQLHIPSLGKGSLSICEGTPQGITQWIDNLPKANLGETARLLYQCLQELNRLDIPSSSRMRMMELLRPQVMFVCKHLEKHFLNQSVVLEDRPRKVANLCQTLQNHLTTGYKLIVVQEASLFRKELTQTLATAIQRSLSSLFGPLVQASQLYCPVPNGLWLEMHLLYRVACSFALQNLPVSDPLAQLNTTQTVENTYIAALMLGCARTNQMRQNAIANLAEVITAWAPLVRLESTDSPRAQFWIDTQQDGPPRLRSLFPDSNGENLLGLNPDLLLSAIEDYLQSAKNQHTPGQLPVTERLQPEQIQHLSAAWGDTAERAFMRTPSEGIINVCIGMSSVHYFLAGETAFGETLKDPVDAETAKFKHSPKGAPDIWARSFDAHPNKRSFSDEPANEIQYKGSPRAEGADDGDSSHEKYSVYPLPLINQSPSGYRLSWPCEVPNQLQAGELLGIQDQPGKNWTLGVVRWIRQVPGSSTQIGVELLAPVAQPCGLQLTRKTDQSSQFLRALLIPEIKAIARPACLITPHLPFQEGNRVLVNLHGTKRRAILDHKQSFTGSFSQFEFHYLEVLPHEQDNGQTARQSGAETSGSDDFDSLWKSL